MRIQELEAHQATMEAEFSRLVTHTGMLNMELSKYKVDFLAINNKFIFKERALSYESNRAMPIENGRFVHMLVPI